MSRRARNTLPTKRVHADIVARCRARGLRRLSLLAPFSVRTDGAGGATRQRGHEQHQ